MELVSTHCFGAHSVPEPDLIKMLINMVFTEGQETKGQETEGRETGGQETEGRETGGQETEGQETEGRETGGQETEGRETEVGTRDFSPYHEVKTDEVPIVRSFLLRLLLECK